MKKRHKIPSKPAQKLFTRTAQREHPKNSLNTSVPMRGGIRL